VSARHPGSGSVTRLVRSVRAETRGRMQLRPAPRDDGERSRADLDGHCLACQRRTGSALGMQARWPKDRVDVTGRYTEYVRISDAWRGADVSLLPGLRTDALLDDRRLAGLDRGPNRRVRR
jgi:hypothetical protein